IIPTLNGKSSPRAVLSRLHEFATEFQFGEGDQFWLVIDKDRWVDASLHEITQLCNDRSYKVALSNPCFELWLLLHFRKTDELQLNEAISCDHIKNIFNPQLADRDEGNYDATYVRWIKYAIEEARKLDVHPDAPFPDCPGTRVYQLVEELMA
ncbi:MAG: RloB family protein, partial [Balneolaceae bacterium]